jgi:hypothetical protein
MSTTDRRKPMARSDEELPSAALIALNQGKMIEAIKVLRVERNLGLKEAKDQVDAYLRAHPDLRTQYDGARAEGNRGGLLWLIVIIVAAVAAFVYFKGG